MTLDEQLNKYLTDAHSIEEQALAQMRTAPDIAGAPELSRIFAEHLAETARHEQLIRERLEARGASPSKLKDAVMAVGGKGFVLFARSQPDTPGKLTAHAYSYEALEEASYELLWRVAERAGDMATVDAARVIRDQELAMRERLEAHFDDAAAASLAKRSPDDLREQVTKYLTDAHALEEQSIKLLERAPKIVGEGELGRIFSEHLEDTRGQQRHLEQRLEQLGGSPSKLKDAALRLGALNWGMFFQGQPDTPGKLAAFAYAVEHLELAGYELLKRVAAHAGDTGTAELAERIAFQERAAAGRIHGAFDRALEASLQAQGVAVG